MFWLRLPDILPLILRSKPDEELPLEIPPSNSEIQIGRRITSRPVLITAAACSCLHAISSLHAPEVGASVLRSIRNNHGRYRPASTSTLNSDQVNAGGIRNRPSPSSSLLINCYRMYPKQIVGGVYLTCPPALARYEGLSSLGAAPT